MGLRLTHGAAPSTPGTGKSEVYTDSADKRVKAIDDAGVITVLGGGGLGISKENLLINGSFRYAQRQDPNTLTTYHAPATRAYAADRWGLLNENASAQWQRGDQVATLEPGLRSRYFGRLKKITSAGKMALIQTAPAHESVLVRNHQVRFQLKMRYAIAGSMTVRLGLIYLASPAVIDTMPGAFIAAWGAVGTDPTWGTDLVALAPTLPDGGTVSGLGMTCVLTSSWARYSAVFNVPDTSRNLTAIIWTNGQPAANDELLLAEAGLYDGTEIHEWAPRPEGEELALCQRFYWKTFNPDTAPAQNVGANTGEFCFQAITAGATAQRGPSLVLPVTQYRTPLNVVTYNPSAANAEVRDETAAADCSATALASFTQGSVRHTATGNAGTAAGNTLGVHVSVNCEL